MNGQRWIPAYVGLGSNLDDPALQVEQGFDALTAIPDTLLVASSQRYRSRPLGPQDQPDFVNAVAGLLTQLDADTLLFELKKLEVALGRAQPVLRWGPRRIDFDLLVYGTEVRTDAALTLPHPGVQVRNWVLYPLSEIAPSLLVPGVGRAGLLAEALGNAGLETLRVDPN